MQWQTPMIVLKVGTELGLSFIASKKENLVSYTTHGVKKNKELFLVGRTPILDIGSR